MEIGSQTSAIIWDLDGTLIDSFEIYAEILQEVAVLTGLTVPEREMLLRNYHGSLEDSISTTLGITDKPSLAKFIRQFLLVQEKYYADPDDHLFVDALALAQKAKFAGMYQIIVTNRAHEGRGNASPRYIVEHSRLNGVIDEVICHDDVTARKPHPDVVRPRLDQLQLPADKTVVIGDQHVDAMLAYNIGAPAVLVGRQGHAPHLESLPNWQEWTTVVKSLDEVELPL